MTIDAILARIADLTPAERADLVARLRAAYDDRGNPLPADRVDQTGVYSVEQLMARARKSS
jgi:hypothetical protein